MPTSPLPVVVSVAGAGPGAVAQIRLTLTTPHNLTSGGFTVDLDPTVFGPVTAVDIIGANGGQRGQSTVAENQVVTAFASDSGGIGQLPGVPAVVITVPVLPSAAAGLATPIEFQFGSTPWTDLAGNLYVPSAPAIQFTVGATLSIDSVTPGGGLLPAGSTIQIKGHGFSASTQVQIAGVPLSGTVKVVGSPFGSTEIDVTLAASADITGRRVLLQNPGGTLADFYPALRGAIQGDSTGDLRFSFPQQTVLGGGLTGFLASGVAVQNPELVPVDVAIDGCGPGLKTSCYPTGTSVFLGPSDIVFAPSVGDALAYYGATSSTPVRILAPLNSANVRNGLSAAWSPTTPTCQINPLVAPIAPCIVALAGAAPVTSSLKLSLYEAVPFTAAVDAAAQPWLSVSPQSGITSSNLTLTVTTDPHLAPGDYSATITITLADPALLPVTVPLTFRVAGSFVSFQNNPPFLYFEAEKTDPIPPPVQLQVTATAAGTPFTVQALTYLNQTPQWLLVSPTQGITPATLNVTVDPSQPITGTVELYVVGPFNSVSEPVGITINSPPGYIYPNPLTFWAKAGGASPPSQTAYATGIEQQDMKLTVATDEGGPWLSAVAGTYVTVQVDSSQLAPGTYNGTVTVSSISQPATVPDQLSVQLFVWSTPPPITLAPSSVELTAPSGWDADAYVMLSSGNLPVDYVGAISTVSGGNWLSVSPDTYETVEISANAQNLPPGKYQGNVAFVAPSGAPPINLPVIFTVTDSVLPTVAPRLPLAISLVNGASLSFGAIAPGELVSIFGAGLAATPGLQVLIDGLAAQVLPVSPWQVNAVVPNELAPQGLATIEVQNNGGRFVTSLNAASAAPGIVTADGTGIGTAQGFTTPAARGSVAKLFVTGIGETNSRKRLSIPRIAITIGGIEVPAEKIHALGNGIYEMEFLIPTTVSPSAAVPIVVSVGSHASQPGVTVPVS